MRNKKIMKNGKRIYRPEPVPILDKEFDLYENREQERYPVIHLGVYRI